MQIRSKAYLQLILLWRSFRGWLPPHDAGVPAETSPSLIFTAVMLAFLLAVLEVDVHRAELESLGLLTPDYPIQSALLAP